MIHITFKLFLLTVIVIKITSANLQFSEPITPVPLDSIPFDSIHEASLFHETFTFRADSSDFSLALKTFAQSYGLRLRCDTIINTPLTIAFEDVNFYQAMEQILQGRNCIWNLNGDEIHILPITNSRDSVLKIPQSQARLTVTTTGNSRIFKINYPRLKRSGQGSSNATLSTSGSGEAGSVQLSTTDEILFWQELEEQLKLLISPNAVMVINKMSGIIYLRDSLNRLNEVHSYLETVIPVITRQVEITARIYEVTLGRHNSLGIDWTAVTQELSGAGIQALVGAASEVIQSSPELKTSTIQADITVDNKLDIILRALKEQGDVKAVSQSRVVTMNNQPALVKIGTDYPFFTSTVTINPTTNQKEVEEEVRIITVGVVLSVTPQISDNRWVTLGIDPVISDLVSTAVSSQGSTAPIVDVKQSSSLVRLRDRSTIRISGLLQTKTNKVHRKIPLLGDIPILKYLFQWSYTKKIRKELVILISPKIL